MPKVMQYRFRQHDTIGNPSAESDERFLSSCFVDTGTLEVASDSEDPRGIVLGRTGAGKTALLKALTDGQDHAINIDPHNLALSYISNSTVLRFFTALNIDMDPFYRFLWRHVFIVEVLKMHFKLDSEEQKVRVIDNLQYTILRKKTHKDAFKYLNTYGTNFLNTTEERVTELTQKIETDLKGTVEVGIRDFMKMGGVRFI